MARRFFKHGFCCQPLQNMVHQFCFQISAWHQIMLTGLVLVLAPTFLLGTRYIHPSSLDRSSLEKLETGRETKNSFFLLSASLEYVQGRQVVWQLPPSPKAILFIAHGCFCRATFFWDKSPNCTECRGLPEERALVIHALTRGYAVVAISSSEECWSISLDMKEVKNILQRWIKDKHLGGLPLVGLGASSGGYFLSALAGVMKFESVVLMISEGIFAKLQIKPDYPPTLFVHMPKDARRALLIQKTIKLLRSKGVQTAEVKCNEVPVTPQFFTRIPGLDSNTSGLMYSVLKASGILDDQGFMKRDGRSVDWRMPLKVKQILPGESDGHLKWEAHVQELLNLAYGYHEMTSLQSREIFEWFESKKNS